MVRLPAWLLLSCLLSGLGTAVTGAYSDDLGMLLTTPEERELIREWREGGEQADMTSREEQPSISEPGIHYNGMVINSRGKTSHWVNGRQVKTPQDAAQLGVSFQPDLHRGLEVRPESRFATDDPIYLQPGQSYNRQGGTLPKQLFSPTLIESSKESAGDTSKPN